MVRYITHDSISNVKTAKWGSDLHLPESFNKYMGDSNIHILYISYILPTPKTEHSYEVVNIVRKIVRPEDIIIFDIATEAYPVDRFDWYKNQFKKHKTYLIQSSLENYNRDDIITSYGFFRYDNSDIKPFNERSKIYSALSRLILGRDQRLIFTYELYRQDLLDKGLVSCGSGEPDGDLKNLLTTIKTMSKEFKEKLPLLLDGKRMSRHGNKKSDYHNYIANPGADAIINVVIESSMNHSPSLLHPDLAYNKGWEKLFFTEKTAKMFNCKQLPLFIAPFNYVKKLRELGFDMFDDIIDHSYDSVESPDARISMVVDELKRFINSPKLPLIVDSYPVLEKRLEHNRTNIKTIGERGSKVYFDKIDSIFRLSNKKFI